MRLNTYDAAKQTITLDAERVAAIGDVSSHYQSLFGNDPSTADLREAYAMKNNTVPDAQHREVLSAFFWWTSWATVTQQPDSEISYTSNWPSEPLVENKPPASTFVWSAFSVLFVIAGIALHAAGEEVFEEVGHRLRCYASETCNLARISDDEFVVTVFGDDEARVWQLGPQKLDIISAPISVKGSEQTLGASVGIALSRSDALNCASEKPDTSMRRARPWAESEIPRGQFSA